MKTQIHTHYQKTFKGKLTLLFFLSSFFFTPNLFAQDFWEEIIVPDSILVYSVFVDQEDSLYLGASSNFETTFRGVYKSNDHGINWNYKGPDSRKVYQLDADVNGTIYAGSGTFLYKTFNGGDNWELVSSCGLDNIYTLLIQGKDTIFAGGWRGFIRSFDGGINWDTTLSQGGGSSFTGIARNSQDQVFVVSSTFISGTGGVFRTDNWGESWEKILTKQIRSIAINAKDELFIGTQWEGILKSIDAGETWINITTDIYDVMSIVVNQEDVIFVGCQGFLMGGVFASYNDGQSWVSINSGLTSNYINKLYVDHNGFVYAIKTTKAHEHELHRSVQTTVGINQKPIVQSYTTQVYPNPINKNNTLWVENKEKEIERIELYNTNAKQVFSKEIGLSNNKLAITLPKLKVGLYHLVIKFKDGEVEYLKQIIY
jgi:Secretion system C-terminal sorting domain